MVTSPKAAPKAAAADPARVNMADPADVQKRRRQFGCTEQQLRQAVSAVGDSAAKVSQYLKNKSTPLRGKAQKYE